MKTGDNIKTKRGYTGTYLSDIPFTEECAVVLNGCTYSAGHWYDVVPKSEITVIDEESKKKVSKGWFTPEIGEPYWTTNLFGIPTEGEYQAYDYNIILNNIVYRTKKECEEAIKINQARIRIEKAHASSHSDMVSLVTDYVISYCHLYFKSNEDKQNFIQSHRHDIKIITDIF